LDSRKGITSILALRSVCGDFLIRKLKCGGWKGCLYPVSVVLDALQTAPQLHQRGVDVVRLLLLRGTRVGAVSNNTIFINDKSSDWQ
jgi:hypothetical protein